MDVCLGLPVALCCITLPVIALFFLSSSQHPAPALLAFGHAHNSKVGTLLCMLSHFAHLKMQEL